MNGNTKTDYLGTVHFTSTDSAAVLPANYTFLGADAGVHTFSATLKTVGSRSISATDTVTGSITGAQSGINVTAAEATTLLTSGFSNSVTAGVAGTMTLTAKDTYGNIATGYRGIVSITSSDPSAVLPANYTFTSSDSGVHSLPVTLKTGGTQTLTATDTGLLIYCCNSDGYFSKCFSRFDFQCSSSVSVIAGTPSTVVVTAKDSFGNTATGYLGTARITSTDGAAVLPANYTFLSSDAGVHSFAVTLKTKATQSITATDTVTSGITGTQAGVVVSAASASQFTVSGYPASVIAGASNTLSVTAKDVYGNIASGFVGTAKLTSSDAAAVLPANYTFISADAGVHSFSVILKTAGTRTITATDTVTSSITGTQSGIEVTGGTASVFNLLGYPASTVAGVSNNFSVTARDAYGNIATGYVGTVSFTSPDLIAVLPSNYTFLSADAGVHTFSATLKTTGTQSIAVADTISSSVNGTQTGLVVTSSAAVSFQVSGFPTSTVAGVSNTVTVRAKDAYSNTAAGYVGTVQITSSDPLATLPSNYTFISGDAGVHNFSVTLKTVGTNSIVATDSVMGSITGTQAAIKLRALPQPLSA